MQIVGYDTATYDDSDTIQSHLALHVADDGDPERIPLPPGTELAYTLKDRHCAGNRSDHHHRPCSDPDAPYCNQHTSTWACARCTGNCNLPLDSCTDEHAVYLAAFAPDTFKVGVTRSWRLRTRLREQGADRGAHFHTVSDGRIARTLEAEYARDLPDRIRIPTKLQSLSAQVDDEAWNALLDDHDVIERYAFDYGLDLDSQPVHETFATGTVLGAKGRILVLEHNGTTYAVDCRDLVGYDVVPKPATRDVQASLGSF